MSATAALKLHFQATDGESFNLKCSREAPLKAMAVKPILEQVFGIPVQEQELIYQDTTSLLLLPDEGTIYPCYSGKIRVRPKVPDLTLRLVQYPGPIRHQRKLQCVSHESIAVVKKRIEEQFRIPMDQMKVCCKSERNQCADYENLAFYRVRDNDTLILQPLPPPSPPRLPPTVPSTTLPIQIKMLTGRTFSIEISSHAIVGEIKTEIREKEGIPQNQQYLIFRGRALDDTRSLEYYNIQSGSHLNLVLRLRGVISSFTHNNTSDPLVKYLMLPETQRQTTPIPLANLELKTMVRKIYDNMHRQDPAYVANKATFYYNPDCCIISEEYRGVLGKFLDFVWTKKTKNEATVDLRLVLPKHVFVQLLLPFAERCSNLYAAANNSPAEVLEELEARLESRLAHRWQGKIVLRMTKGPTGACIHFHRDGPYATYTWQLALNEPEEYEGGKLCYFADRRLQVLTRPAGSLVGHDTRVLHAVTAVTSGVRKSLFIVDYSNGRRDDDIFEATAEDATSFWDSSTLCSYCFLRFSNQKCDGCGNQNVMCSECSDVFHNCPLCRILHIGSRRSVFSDTNCANAQAQAGRIMRLPSNH